MNAHPCPSGGIFHLTFSHGGKRPRLFQDRDTAAFCELTAPFYEQGWKYRTLIYLYPKDPRRLDEYPLRAPADVVVLTTRPPLDDGKILIPPRKKLLHSGSALEIAIFDALGKYFSYCTRKRIALTEEAADLLKCEDAYKWREVEVREYNEPGNHKSKMEVDALVKLHHLEHGQTEEPPLPPPYRTVAFFVRINNVAKIGCNLIASFGMDGYTTLIWNRIVRSRWPDWLNTPGFVMAELMFESDIPEKPTSPEFADDRQKIHVRILTEPNPLPLPSDTLRCKR